MNWPALGGLILLCVVIFFIGRKLSSSKPEEAEITNEELRRAVMMDTLLRYGLLEEMIQPGKADVLEKIMLKL